MLALALALCFSASPAWAADAIPAGAAQWRRTVVREVRAYWGILEPVATFAGQIHQESGWRPDARSAYAAGLGQQTPGTVTWLGQLFREDLGGGNALDPRWSIRALVLYDRKLHRDLVPSTMAGDERWAFALAGYNGGAGWIKKEQRLAAEAGRDPARWFGHVEAFCKRAVWACKENRDYPRKILFRWRPLYSRAGW